MATIARQGELQVQIAQELFGLLGDLEWSRAEVIWSSAGGVSEVAVRIWDPAGRASEPNVRLAGLNALFRELKETMADPAKGTWLSARLQLTRQAQFSYDYDYDRRFYWDTGLDDIYAPPAPPADIYPDDDLWIAEFEAFPRRPEYLPAWAPAGKAAPSQANLNLLSRALATEVRLPDGLAGLDRQPGWAEVVSAIRHEVVTRIQTEPYLNLLDELDREHSERAFDGLWQEVHATVAPSILGASAARSLALWRGLAAVQGRQEPADLAEVDPERPLPDTSRAYRELSSAVVELAQNEITQRFPGPAD